MRLFAFIGLLALAAVAMIGRTFDLLAPLFMPRRIDDRPYWARNPAPRSIFDTRRMGLA